MKVGFVNRSTAVRYDDFRNTVTALNYQAKNDFGPMWSIKASAIALPKNFIESLDKVDAIIYIEDKPKKDDGTIGYHDRRLTGMPYGVVYHDISDKLGESFSTTASHELLELLLNPWIGSYEWGPHPETGRYVFHWREVCDCVQAKHYTIENKNGSKVDVSNFVLPLYFTTESEAPGPGRYKANDWLESRGLKSFGLLKGGYIGYFDPRTGKEGTVFANRESERRFKVKAAAGSVRRKIRMSKSLEIMNMKTGKAV